MIHGDSQKYDRGKQSVFGDVENNSGIDDQTCEKAEQQVVEHDRLKAAAQRQKIREQNSAAPEGTDHGSDDPVLALLQHVGGVGLHTLQGSDDRIERLALEPAHIIKEHAEPYSEDGAENSLSREGEL